MSDIQPNITNEGKVEDGSLNEATQASAKDVKPKKPAKKNPPKENKLAPNDKKVMYAQEQKEVLAKLYKIIGITEENKKVFYNEIDEQQQQDILALDVDCKKYFSASSWNYFSKNPKTRRHLSLMKSILKSMKIKTEKILKYNVAESTHPLIGMLIST